MTSALPRIPEDSPLREAIESRIPELSDALLDAAVKAVRWPTTLPSEPFQVEIGPLLAAAFPVVVTGMIEGRQLSTAEVSAFAVPIIERHAEDGIPLPVLLTALHGGVRRFWELVVELVPDIDAATLAALGAHLSDLAGTCSIVITEIYQDSDFVLRANKREQLRTLCKALVAGDPTAAILAEDASVELSDRYDILAIDIDTAPTPQTAHDVLVAQRRMRHAQHVLYEFGSADILNTFDGYAGTVLLPTPLVGPGALEALVDALATRFGVEIYAAECRTTELLGIPAAVAETTEIARLARQLGGHPGLHHLEDLLFEYQATRPGPARDFLAQRIAPLQQHPSLLDALEMHLRHGADRKAAAAELFIHPNTLTYRLRRVHEFTGIDPSDPHGSRLLAAALTIHLVDHAEK
ncbi:Proline-responsive transcriptional activator PutR [Mycobacterium talmoniae]|uniref:Proline-responsive transcriptional activator PutR n=1 Tax=Mycobacterium talmoniae TaxID=1858794 RepID=A0A2S8BI50_9MYCO|nr:Proline-responsive transcriptional activator PutR [Mycobacterium talmoniae]